MRQVKNKKYKKKSFKLIIKFSINVKQFAQC